MKSIKLTDEQFKVICEKVSKDSFKFMKKKITKELETVSKGNTKLIDSNTALNVVITSTSILSGNMLNLCKIICKDVNIEKLWALHNTIINSYIDDNPTDKDTIN